MKIHQKTTGFFTLFDFTLDYTCFCFILISADLFHCTPYFLLIVQVREGPKGVVFGILWNGRIVRVNVATLKGVAFGISRTSTKRLDLSLVFRFRPHNRRDPEPRRDRQNGTKKKKRASRDD